MSTPNDGGPAFPTTEGVRVLDARVATPITTGGMTLRDYFAAAALQGLTASDCVGTVGDFARKAYELADAMLAERAEQGGGK